MLFDLCLSLFLRTLNPGMITLSYSTYTMMQISGVSNKLLLQQLLLHQDHLPHHPQPQGHLLQHPLLPQHLLVKIGLLPKDARGGSGDQRRPRDATRNFSVKGAGRLVKFVHLDFDFKTKLLSRGRNTSNHLPITLFVVSYTRCLFQKCQHSLHSPTMFSGKLLNSMHTLCCSYKRILHFLC